LTLHEKFLTFVDRTGKGLANTIIQSLTDHGLDVAYIRRQGYYGYSVMSGRLGGVQAEIKRICPTAVYVPCSSHVMYLSVVHACNLNSILNALGIVNSMTTFFSASTMRSPVLRRYVEYATD